MFSLRTANSNEFRETGSIEFEPRMMPFSFTSWLKNENVGTLEFLPEFSVSLWLFELGRVVNEGAKADACPTPDRERQNGRWTSRRPSWEQRQFAAQGLRRQTTA